VRSSQLSYRPIEELRLIEARRGKKLFKNFLLLILRFLLLVERTSVCSLKVKQGKVGPGDDNIYSLERR
jgi:hypothetical protein